MARPKTSTEEVGFSSIGLDVSSCIERIQINSPVFNEQPSGLSKFHAIQDELQSQTFVYLLAAQEVGLKLFSFPNHLFLPILYLHRDLIDVEARSADSLDVALWLDKEDSSTSLDDIIEMYFSMKDQWFNRTHDILVQSNLHNWSVSYFFALRRE